MAETQTQAISQILRSCSVFSAEKAEVSVSPAGWTVIDEEYTDAFMLSFLSADLMLQSIRDINERGPFRPMDVILDTFQQRFGSSKKNDYDVWYLREHNPRYLSHSSGWSLIAFFDTEFNHSYCRAWHDAPDAETVSFLSQPVLGIDPKQGPFGQMVHVSVSDDGTFNSEHSKISIFLNDPDKPWEKLADPNHPIRFLPRVFVGIF